MSEPRGTLQSIHRYPIKSLIGETISSTLLAERGLPGDRVWAVRDEVRGGIRGAKQLGRLLELAATFNQPPTENGSTPATIHFQDGSTATTQDGDINQRLSAAIDHEVTLWPLLPPEQLEHYERGAPSHSNIETHLRSVFARTPEEPLPDLSKFPQELMRYECPPGTYFDAYPILLVTAQSMNSLRELAPDSRIELPRFRPNLVVDLDSTAASPNPAFPELAWANRRIAIGDAVLETTIACPRCVMVTRPVDGLPQDPRLMRTLVQKTEGNFGVYARIEKPGSIAVGDSVRL